MPNIIRKNETLEKQWICIMPLPVGRIWPNSELGIEIIEATSP